MLAEEIAICVILILLSIVAILRNCLLRLPFVFYDKSEKQCLQTDLASEVLPDEDKENSLEGDLFSNMHASTPQNNDSERQSVTSVLPFISIVIATYNEGEALQRNIPKLFEQNYSPGYEIIVVDESSTDDTSNILKRLKATYPNLRSSFVPANSKYLCRRKLAMTLGIKAARGEWVLLTGADCYPSSPLWLASMGRMTRKKASITDNVNLVLGYTNYESSAPAFWRYEKMLSMCRSLRKICRSSAYRYDGRNMLIRKNVFMDGGGFHSNLYISCGEYDFLANDFGVSRHTNAVISKESKMLRAVSKCADWHSEHIKYMETRRYLCRSFKWRISVILDHLPLHLSVLLNIGCIVFGAVEKNVALLCCASFCLIATVIIRALCDRKATLFFFEKFSLWLLPIMDLLIAWRTLFFMIAYAFTKKPKIGRLSS